MKTLRERLNSEWLFCDGGSGTILQRQGLRPGEFPDTWNLTHPEAILDLYSGYLNAGCDIFNTNTFGTNRFHFPEGTDEIVRAAVSLAKEARIRTGREDAFIALDIGPTGKLLEPYGDLPFEEAVDAFGEVIRTGAACGADLVLIETMNDSYEAKAALLAAKENCSLPVFITTTYDSEGRLLNGASPESLIPMLEGLGADALGINCSLGPDEMVSIIDRIRAVTSLPLIVNPNAGLPKTVEGRTVYLVSPESFTRSMTAIAAAGAQVMGGCCGTTPEHIRSMREAVRKLPFVPAKAKKRTIVTSAQNACEIGTRGIVIGERINPTGKKRFRQALLENDLDYVISQGLDQEDAGADILDVNVGVPGIDEAAVMKNVMQKLQAVTSLPLQIDSSDPRVLECAVRLYNGKPMINSVSGKKESLETVLPIAAKYGAVVVGLCLDENGIPETADGRIAIGRRIIEEAERLGIPKHDIVLDGLTLTISSEANAARVTLETVRRIREELGVHAILGVSNVSFGLPERKVLNAAFLTMAMQNGLSSAIINPNDALMMSALRASDALLGQDENCLRYIDTFRESASVSMTLSGKKTTAAAEAADLFGCIVHGQTSQAAAFTKKLLESGTPAMELIDSQLIPALDEVGKGFEKKTVFLPQLLMSADAAKASFAVIKDAMKDSGSEPKGTIILATVKGDIHDIGKNIVKVLLENYGYNVLDLGKDVAPETIVQAAIDHNVSLVGLSALMTTTVTSMKETIELFRKVRPDTTIIVGGAVLTQEYADQIGADAYAKDAMETVRFADRFFGFAE
ncbi:MAG: homocysteine S-methyltransferase family protein [Solobacterium sp.]|nr:homocysteine S-methyltransferase family protein [Solobacterium sp.]